MKKNKLIPIILAAANIVIYLPILIFLTPTKIPLLAGMYDEIIFINSKWFMLIGILLPAIIMTFQLLFKNKNLNIILTTINIFITYNNMLAFSYFCSGSVFKLGELSEIPLSVAVFLPVALGTFVYGSIIKNISYKNHLGIVSKRTTTTEFIWKQSHFQASYHYRLSGLILFIISIICYFVRYPLIELAIFIVGLIIPRIIVEIGAGKMTKKYKDMKQKHDHLEEVKNSKAE